MHIVATAGHVDHGKSTLVKALTGMEPDRLAEEKTRGMSIVLGYAWTDLAEIGPVGFIDFPGHHRLLGTSIAGLGTAQAVLFVVAADDPWMPQAEEHLRILDAVGMTRGVVAVTRCDLAEPQHTIDLVRKALDGTALAGSPIVPVSAHTGAGLQKLRHTLATVLNTLPSADRSAEVRLWVDREFTMKGIGSVVTGSLLGGTIVQGQPIESGPGKTYRVRGIQIGGQSVPRADAPTRVALNLTGKLVRQLSAGDTLTSLNAWHYADNIDVWADPTAGRIPTQAHLHIGSSSQPARIRQLGHEYFRLKVERQLPLHIGDRAILRDPGTRRLWPIRILDPSPPELTRRGAAGTRANALLASPLSPSLDYEVESRGLVGTDHLRRLGVPIGPLPPSFMEAQDWLLSPAKIDSLQKAMSHAVNSAEFEGGGVPLSVLSTRLNVASEVLAKIVQPPLAADGSLIYSHVTGSQAIELARILSALNSCNGQTALITAERLEVAGLHGALREHAVRSNQLVRITPTRFVLPETLSGLLLCLTQLRQPFTTSEARVAFGENRADTILLLEHLDARHVTQRLPDSRRIAR